MPGEKPGIEPFRQFLASLPDDQKGQTIDSIAELFKPVLRASIEEDLPPIFDRMLAKIGYSEEIAGLVQLLAAKSNDNKQDVLRKALTLYGLALDAQEKGNRMAILRPDDVIVHDVIGIGQGQESAQPVSR